MIVRTANHLKESLQQTASALLKPFDKKSSGATSTRSSASSSSTIPNNNTNVSKLHDEKGDDVSVVYLVRHGDRFDYANPSWLENAKSAGNITTDPPLSALGHRQASETGQHFASLTNVSKILVSPYLRVIQTACPTSDALNIPIHIEEGLSESHATPNVLPSAQERFAYFPHVDPTYKSMVDVQATPGVTCSKTGKPCESFSADYIKRIKKVAETFETEFRGQTVICFSHAASVALVAALLKCTLKDLKFAPCGIFKLKRTGDGPWELCINGISNPHVSENSTTTYPWGFDEKHFIEEEHGEYYGSSEGIGLDFFVVN
mmetsp:Transcript_10115/g.14314  ORF Transcript_10115/g.14314 Transcript_10115/m.14314 type:complete len:319 (-) Transcript_10115:2173-3129(-)